VSAVPASFTPNVNNGIVYGIAQVGSSMVIGGTFTNLSPADDAKTIDTHDDIAAFDATTGAISSSFDPSINGQVNAVLPGPAAGEVYVGGDFSTIDGVNTKLALLNVSSGSIVAGWTSPTLSNSVDSMVLVNGRLIIAGAFHTVNGATHDGLASLDPSTGAVTDYVDLAFTGHHDYGTKCDPTKVICADGVVGVRSITVNPAGTELMALGNFIHVSGQSRDQLAKIDLGASQATVDTGWSSDAYTAPCLAASFDSNVRAVEFSPDGKYFVVVATGASNLKSWGVSADGTKSPCDAVARFNNSQEGQDVEPVWVDRTGNDALLAVAITPGGIYVGGHERWMNNSLGRDDAQPGSIPRPGIGAIDPANGMPETWNPGRNPRGAGVQTLLATPDGLWLGSDTNYIGPMKYLRAKVAFFPYSGGSTLPSDATASLPGDVYLAGATAKRAASPNRFAYVDLTTNATSDPKAATSPIDWSTARGAFYVDGEVVYGKSDGNLYERSFDGSTFGAEVKLDPYHDATWDSVQTGSGQTYVGVDPDFFAEIPKVTSMFFGSGRLYYTLSGKSHLYYRWYEPDDGAVGEDEYIVGGTHSWSNVAGAVLAGNHVYFGNRSTGQLESIAWSHDAPSGTASVLNPATDWASRGLLLLPRSTPSLPTPAASFTPSCGSVATCSFTATPWSDPAGGTTTYHWSFGDGSGSAATSTGASHSYVSDGTFDVTLTVSDSHGGAASKTIPVTINAPIRKIHEVGAAAAKGHRRSVRLTLPKGLRSGDELVLVASDASATVKPSLAKSWHRAAAATNHGLRSSVFTERVRSSSASGSSVRVSFKHSVAATVIVTAYRGASSKPIAAIIAKRGPLTTTHTTAVLHRLSAGLWAIWSWNQRTSSPAKWSVPKVGTVRARLATTSSPSVGSMVADSAAAMHGTQHSGTARSTRRSRGEVDWAIALSPAVI
jgi:hypothetical protein